MTVREPDLFGGVLTDIAEGPLVGAQGGITEALMRRLHEKGMSLTEMGGSKIMARSEGTMKAHARALGLAFDDYTPRALKPRYIKAKKREMKRDALAYYKALSDANPDYIVLLQMGDFYEAMHDGAAVVAADLGLVLTKRKDVPMCGLPVHALGDYLKKLMQKARRVLIVETR